MARRDVDLVIKARDEAAGVVDSITKALNEFVEAQQELDTRSERTESTLTNLGVAIGRLDKEMRGLSFGDKLQRELDKSAAALNRIEARFAETTTESQRLEKQLKSATAQNERYSSKLERTGAALTKQTAALKAARKDQTDLTRAYKEAETAQNRLAARQERLPGLIAKAGESAEKAARRFDDLSAQILGTAEPSRTLREQLAASERAVTRTSTRLTELRTEYAGIAGQLRAASSAVTFFANQQERAASEIARQERIIEGTKQRYAELKVQASSAGRQQSDLARELDRVSSSLRQQEAAVERARGNYAELVQSTGQAEAALRELGSASIGALTKQLQDQRRAVLESKRSYIEARTEATQLGAAIAKATKPTKELQVAFDQSRARLAAQKSILLENRVAYEQLGATLRGTSTDFESIRAAQDRYASVQGELRQKIGATTAAAERQQLEIAQLAGVSGQAGSRAGQLANSADRLANANRRAAGSTNQLAEAYRRFYGGTRQSLSILQRIRGEVLSLVAAYGGLFAAIEVLRGTVNATQQLEAAQSRLGVAFDGDTARVAQELDFLRRTAARLGVDFGTLATEYSKFQIATKNTAISAEAARKIFVQVTEAARVNRSSTKELSGVFVALTQIVSKGAVQMEELRQQLGDRLPGAIQIMADGLGVTTAELIKMMEQGQITESALIAFGDELEKRFGGGLNDALESVTVAMGRLQAAAFEAFLQFGNAGFMEGFQDLLEDLTETLRSAEFQDFAARLSSGLGTLARFIGFAVRNFDLLVSAALAFIGLRLTPVVLAMTARLKGLSAALTLSTTGFTALQARAAAAGIQITRTQLAVRNLTRAFRVLLSSTGIGLAVTAISFAIGQWATSASEATEAMTTHRDIVDKVKNAYDEVGGAVDEWKKKLDELTVSEVQNNLLKIEEALESVRETVDATITGNEDFGTNFFGFNFRNIGADIGPAKVAIREITAAFRAGTLPIEDYVKEIDDALQANNNGSDSFNRFAARVIEAARSEVELAQAQKDANAILEARTGGIEEATEAAEELDVVLNDLNSDGFDPKASADYQAAMDGLNKIMDETSQKSETLEEALKIEGAFEQAIANAQTLDEYVDAFLAKEGALANVFQQGVDGEFGNFTDGNEAAAAFLRKVESFSPNPYYDVNAFRAGFGSDTVTLSDGTIVKVREGMRVAVGDANRDLARRINQEFRPIAEKAVGSGRFAQLTAQQQAALISIAYNSGFIPRAVAAAVRAGNDEAAVQAILGDINRTNNLSALSADEKRGVANRRRQEAALFASSAGVEPAVREQQRLDEERQRERERAAEERQKQREHTQETIEGNEFEIEQQKLINAGKEREAAIREAIAKARADDPNITQAEIDKIREQTGAMFDLEQAKKNARTESEAAKDAEAEVNRLLELQKIKREQLKAALEEGDTETAATLRNELVGLNEQLETATAKATAMWQAVGGSEADLAIAKIEKGVEDAKKLGNEGDRVYFSWKQVGEQFINGVASAFDRFAQSVAEGVSIGEAARNAFLQFASDFLRQIAQMIIQQAIFNALSGTKFGGFLGIGTAHSGGVVGGARVGGGGNQSRRVNPVMFAAAVRYHSGGIAGLRPGEVPAILKQGEEVLTRDDPRHVLNNAAAAAGGGKGGVTVVNAFDGTDALDQALAEDAGNDVFLNYARRRKTDIVAALGIKQ